MGANNHYPMSGKALKQAVVPRTISLALRMGRGLAEARTAAADPVGVVTEIMGGVRLFEGRVVQVHGEDVGGFYVTKAVLEGVGSDSGRRAELVIKNETMALWVDGRLRSVFPDLIRMLDARTGRGFMSVEVVAGLHMVLVGVPCHQRLRGGLNTELGRQAFGGWRYGCPDTRYTPLEELG